MFVLVVITACGSFSGASRVFAELGPLFRMNVYTLDAYGRVYLWFARGREGSDAVAG